MQIGVVYPQTELGGEEAFDAEYVALSRGPDTLAGESDAWRAAGGTHFAIATMGFGHKSGGAHIDYIASTASALKNA